MRKTVFIFICILSAALVFADDNEQLVEQVSVGVKKTFRLTGTSPFVGHYIVSVSEQDVPKDKFKWYFFVMPQPKQSSTQLMGTPSKIQITKAPNSGGTTKIKQCIVQQQTDACFIKNNQFDYKTEKLKISVHCQKECQFQLMTEIDSAYDLQLDTSFKLDFENTAYSKLFTLNTEGKDFFELRITLQPKGFIKYGQPIVLLANYGLEAPTKNKYDFKGIHLWNQGQGIYIRKSQMKQRTLTILIQGPEKNVLDLSVYGWQKQQKIQLMQYWPEFDYLRIGQVRQFIVPINASLDCTYRIKTITFSGSVEISKVQKLEQDGLIRKTTALNYSMPNKKYGQFQFRLSKQVIKKQKIQKISIKMIALKQSTYIVNFARQQQGISQIFPYISQSSILQPNQVDQYFIKIEQLIEQSKQKKTSKIQVILGNIAGNINVQFYKCNVAYKIGSFNIRDCEKKSTNQKDFTKIETSRSQNRGSEKRFWFDIQWLDYVKKSDKDKTQIVYQMVIVVYNANNNAQSTYQIQYKNKDRIYLLKQGQLTKDRVAIGQKRHYKFPFLNNNQTSQVRIHCTKISGEVIFAGSLVDPRASKQHDTIRPQFNILVYKFAPDQKVTEVFLQVQGLQSAYYSITTQVIRKSESNPTKKNGTGYNQLIVREDIPYEFLISPGDSIVLQLHSTTEKIKMNFKSTATVQVCMTQRVDVPPYPPNCQIRNDYFLEMDEQLKFDNGLVANIGIKNTNNFNVSIKITMSKSSDSCESSLMNQVMFKMIDNNGKDIQGRVQHCIQYNLNRDQQVELIVDFNKQYQYLEGQISATINNKEVIKILSPSHIFSKQEIESLCAGTRSLTGSDTNCFLKVQFTGIKNARVKVMAQYTDQPLRLMDGVSHSVHNQMKKTQPNLFYFAIHNYEDVTVVLQNKVGQYKIFAKIMKYSQFAQSREENKTTQLYPSRQKKDFESSNPFYYLQQIIVIPKDKIEQNCKNQFDVNRLFGMRWVDCVITVAVVLQGTNQVQRNGKFVIEITQKNRQLKTDVPMSGYLQKKSVAFYNYQSQKEGTIVISVSNQNKFCLDIYLMQGAQRASSSRFSAHAKRSNNLIYNNAKKGSYSITIQANQNCPYTITAYNSKQNVAKIKKGTFTDISLSLGQQKFFLFQNLLNQTFKIVSLHKNGQVIISARPILRQNLKQELQQSNKANFYNEWIWSNKDSVKIPHNSSGYCVDCYYLISIKAQRQTEASIIIPTPQVQLPITTDSYIQDLLQVNQSSIYRVFTGSKSQFQLLVQFGKVRIIIKQSDKDIVSFNQTFSSSKSPIVKQFSLSQSTQSYDFLRYTKITIMAQQESYFSFAIISTADPNKRAVSGVKYGIPQYIYLEQNKQKCLSGQMTASIDTLLLSFSKSDKTNAENVQVVIKLNQRQVSFDKQVGSNQILLRINSLLGPQANLNKKYNLCLKSKEAIAITFIQSSPLNYWPEGEYMTIRKEMRLTFGAQGKAIIQLNECKSRASAQIFSQFQDLASTTSIIKQRRRSNNLVEFIAYGAIYAKIKAQRAIVRWFNVDQNTGVGCGYDEYKVGRIRVVKQGTDIQVIVDPVEAINQTATKSKISSITYEFVAAKQQMQMYSAMNCGQGQFVVKTVTVNSNLNKDVVRASFNATKQLVQVFSKYTYFLIGVKANVQITLPGGQKQSYRFFYPYQQVSKEMLTGNGKIGPYVPPADGQEQEGGLISTIGYILLFLVLVVVVYYVYSNYVKKCFKRKQRIDQSMGKQMKYFDLSENR